MRRRTVACATLVALWTALHGVPAWGAAQSELLTLAFSDAAGVAEDCAATRTVQRPATLPPDAPLAARLDAALRTLFAGVNEKERAAGLSDAYDQLFMEPEPLPAYYRGVTVVDGVAVVDFSAPALSYLNSEACRQALFKQPIVATLLAFEGIDGVDFSIDGVVVTEWDA